MHCTYNGWKRRGRQVLAGAYASFRNEYGDPMFSIKDTKVFGGVEKGRGVGKTITTRLSPSGRVLSQSVQYN